MILRRMSTENELLQRISQLETENQLLKEELKIFRLLKFGPQSEKLTTEDERQIRLFNEAEDASFTQSDDDQIELTTVSTDVKAHTKKKRSYGGRTAISEALPREVIEYDIPDEDKSCSCGQEKTCIGEDVSERIQLIPAKAIVKQERKKKYVCRSCEGTDNEEKGVQTAEGIKHLIPRSIADESLLAWSISEKFEYALPFYRLSKRFTDLGVQIPRATLGNLTIKVAEACKPLLKELKRNILAGPLINIDETTVQVLKEPGRKAQSKSWMWVYVGGPSGRESVLFDYNQSRGHEIPKEFLTDYAGWIQTDDYGAYHTAVKALKQGGNPDIRHILCWAHARRNFFKYWQSTDKKSEVAGKILELISDLFALEDLRDNFSARGFKKQRANRAVFILSDLKKLLEDTYPMVPPSLSLGKAIAYTLDNWEQLILYLKDSHLVPSNNIAENAIRPFVIGRKNWMFSASVDGANASANMYSLIETAKKHGHTVHNYLYYIFSKLPYCSVQEDYEALLPFNIPVSKIEAFSTGLK